MGKPFFYAMDIFEEKKKLRKKVKELKQTYSLEEKKIMSQAIWKQVENNHHFLKANTIMAYWSMDDEVFTHDFIQQWANEKQIILPVVRGDELELKEFTGINELVAGESFGIPEPQGKPFEQVENIEFIIVPGIAFDKQGNRMGRGKAYYDKLLHHSKSYKIGVCFHFQLFSEVPFDELDVKMDEIIFNKM